jgi:hypothetical protein
MSSLLEKYNSMSAEEQAGLGKVSSKINTPGVHLVTIESMKVIDGSRVKIEFKDTAGQIIDYTDFLTNKDPAKVEATVQRVMNRLTHMCNAAGTNLKSVLSRSVPGTETYKTGTVPTEEYPSIKSKSLYITTTSEIEPDEKDANKVWIHQVVDTFNFFDTKKRSALEISTNVDEGKTMEAADAKAKATFAINYRHTANKAAIAKLAELSGGQYTPTVASAQTTVADDEI